MFRIKIFPKRLQDWVKADGIKILHRKGKTGDQEIEIIESSDGKRPSELAIELHPDEDMILRDYLALDRTVMSNEQSLLSYLRTGLSFTAAGVALFHINQVHTGLVILGTLLIVGGIVLAWTGFARFRHMQLVLGRVKRMGSEHAVAEEEKIKA